MGTGTNKADEPRTHLAYATLALSAGAFLLGLYAVARPPPAPEKAAASVPAPASDTRTLEDAITRLRRDVDALQQGAGAGGGADAVVLQRLSALEAIARAGDPRAAAAPQNGGRARYKSLTSSATAITVRQNKDGTFSVTSTDAALTGKPISVDGVREDGTVDTYTIVAPPPGAPASR